MTTIAAQTQPQGFLHRLIDPRIKILYVVWVFLMASVLMHPMLLLCVLLVTVAGIFLSRVTFLEVARSSRIGLLIAAASWLLWILFLRAQGEVLASIGPLKLSAPGVFNGLSVASRIAAILFSVVLVFKTTNNREVMTALYRLRVPIPSAMVIGITLRLIPQLQAEHAIIVESQRSRAVEFNRGGLFTRMKNHTAYIIPLVLRALKITSDLSLAMEARAFDPYSPRTFPENLEFRASDYLLLFLMSGTLLAAFLARFLGFGGMPAPWAAR